MHHFAEVVSKRNIRAMVNEGILIFLFLIPIFKIPVCLKEKENNIEGAGIWRFFKKHIVFFFFNALLKLEEFQNHGQLLPEL